MKIKLFYICLILTKICKKLMEIDKALNFEKETYDKNFKIGYEEGMKQAQVKIEENGFRDGVEVN